MFALVDCNNFYASCERLFQPQFSSTPIAVLSNNDGCIIARSDEIKALGVPMGAPYHLWKDTIAAGGGKVFSANFQLYGDLSNRVMSILREFTSQLEVYSIDEAFLSMEGLSAAKMLRLGNDIRQTILQYTGLPISIGFARTKTLAKIANHRAKKISALNGVCVMCKPEQETKVLQQLPVNEIWGIGRRLSERLVKNKIETALQLRESCPKNIRQGFSVVGERIVLELRGQPCLEIDNTPSAKKQIMCTRSFGRKVKDYNAVAEAIAFHTTSAAVKLRKQNHLAQGILLYLRTNPFSKNEPYLKVTDYITLSSATNDTRALVAAAHKSLKQNFRAGYAYHKAGIILCDLVEDNLYQPSLLEERKPDSGNLMTAIDKLNSRYNNKLLLRFGSIGQQLNWQGRSNLSTPRYTSQWDEIASVK